MLEHLPSTTPLPPRPRPCGPLQTMLDRAAWLDYDGVDTRSLTARSAFVVHEYRRITDRFGAAALFRHIGRVQTAIIRCLDSYGPDGAS